jgi:hypothetical protein
MTFGYWRKNVKLRLGLILALFAMPAFVVGASAQEESKNTETATCTFDDGNELSVRYNPAEYKKGYEIPKDKPWAPGDTPMLLFTPTPITAGSTTLPTGAYSMYITRTRNDWTLTISRNIKQGAPYDASQDVVRLPMGTGRTSSPRTTFSAHLGHIAPKVCSIQINFGDTGAFADFTQKQ